MATGGAKRGPGPERAFAPALASASARGAQVVLSSEESGHLVRVRRVGEGHAVVLFDGEGLTMEGRLLHADPRAAVVEVLAPAPDREPRRSLSMAVSPPEAPRADALVAALAELGVRRLIPLIAARTPPGRERLARTRAPRWRRLAVEAAKWSGRGRLLQIEAPQALADLLRPTGGPEPAGRVPRPGPAAGAILLDPDPMAPSLADLLPHEGDLPLLLVGPEGGFTEEEILRAEASGAARARLGSPALRTGTAALAGAALALCR